MSVRVAKPARPQRPVVVLRVPRFTLPLPGLLDRYVTREYLGFLLLVAASFWSIFVLTEFMDLFDDIQHNNVKGRVVLHYYLFHGPFIMHLIAPVIILVTTLITFGVMSRRNEITAMKAGGISVYRTTLPAVVLGLIGSLGMFLMGEYILPTTNRIAARDFNIIKGRPPQSASYLERRWILGGDGRFYNYDYLAEGALPDYIVLSGLSVYDVDPESWLLRERLHAARAAWNGVSYDLERGWRRSFSPDSTYRTFTAVKTREIEPPSYFRREQREPDTLGFGELRSHIESIEALGLDVTRLRVQLHKKLAFPVLGVVMTLIGIPFAFVVGRRGRAARRRHQPRRGDRLLGVPGDLRGARQQRPAAADAGRLGPQPGLLGRGPVPGAEPGNMRGRPDDGRVALPAPIVVSGRRAQDRDPRDPLSSAWRRAWRRGSSGPGPVAPRGRTAWTDTRPVAAPACGAR